MVSGVLRKVQNIARKIFSCYFRYKPRTVFALIFLLYITIYTGHAAFLSKTVYGDGIYYYSWLRSVVIDGDIDFSNEYDALGGSQTDTPEGKTGNVYSIGPAIFWSSAFLWVHSIFGGSGYEFHYQYAVGLMSVLYACAGLVFTYIALLRFVGSRQALFATVAVSLGTNLLFYGSVDPVNSHAVSFFASSVFFVLVTRKERTHPLVLGFVLGAVALVRMQDSVLAILALPALKRMRSLAVAGAGYFLVILPQFISWNTLYGSYTKSPYLYVPGNEFYPTRPSILSVLFSLNNGACVWTPIVCFAFFGLVYLAVFQRNIRFYLLALAVVLQIYVVSSWSIWWQGASYSGRMFVSLIPVFAVGISVFPCRRYAREFFLLCTANTVLIAIYLIYS